MTVKEKAEEYVSKYVGYGWQPHKGSAVFEAMVDSYRSGHYNAIQWHDLRKDPNDLPSDYRSVWTNKGGACHDKDGWYDDHGWVTGIIAWCEPKFEEDTDDN